MGKKKEKKKGQGNPFKRGDTWTYIVYVQDPTTGKRKQKWVGGFESKKEAADALAKARVDIAENKVSTWGDMAFEDYVEKYFEWLAPRVKLTTLFGQQRKVSNHIAPLNGKKVNRITLRDIEQLEASMNKRHLKASTKRSYHRIFKSIFTWGVRHGDIAKNPYDNFQMEKTSKRAPTTPTKEEIKFFLSKATGTKFYLPALLAVSLGLRRGEVFGLQFGDFDQTAMTVHICRQITVAYNSVEKKEICFEQSPKTEHSDRFVPVPQSLMDYIVQLQNDRQADNTDWVVASANHTTVLPNIFGAEFSRFVRKTGLAFRFHDLRHAYAVMCMENGVPLRTIADTMGHTTIDMTANIYCGTKEISRATADAMNRVVSDVLAKVISNEDS